MLPSSLLLVTLLCLSYFDMLIRFNTTTNPDSILYHRNSTGKLGSVGYVYVQNAMGMTITNLWKLFCYEVKRYHIDWYHRIIGMSGSWFLQY